MTQDYGEFLRPPTRYVRLRPDGLRIGNHTFQSLTAYIEAHAPVRRLWKGGKIVCRSEDGLLCASGKHQSAECCPDCNDDARCQRRIAVEWYDATSRWLLELPLTSARAFARYLEVLNERGLEISAVPTTIHVAPREQNGRRVGHCLFSMGDAESTVCCTPDRLKETTTR